MTVLINTKTGERFETALTNEEAIVRFSELFASTDNWLNFWIQKAVKDADTKTQTKSIQFISDSFLIAIGAGLKRPMIRCHYKNQRFKLYLSQKGTLCMKSGRLAEGTHDPVGDETYVGCLLRGKFLPGRVGDYRDSTHNRRDRPLTPTEAEFLDKLAESPVQFLAQCSKDMNRCCYCNQPLEDPRSKAVGYGKTCASRWCLPWGTPEYMEKAPSFAKVYNEDARMICTVVRADPTQEFVWEQLGDWLDERGLPRCKMPKTGTGIPRNDDDQKVLPIPAKQLVSSRPAHPPIPTVEDPKPEVENPTIVRRNGVTLIEVGSENLTWDTPTKTFSADASDFGLRDGFPETVEVRSTRTGTVKAFKSPKLNRDTENELVSVTYSSEDGLFLILFND